jgi:predicted DsbA family dithiol-disulfide isomerase
LAQAVEVDVTTPVTVEMFLDVSCPWCHGALETNRRLLDELAADAAVPPIALQWRFMRLHPMPREGGLPVDEYYASWSDGDPAKIAAAHEDVQDYVTSVGVRVDPARYTYLHDPLTAHRLLAAVRDDGGDDVPGLWSLARAVFSANFVHGVDVSDLAALRGAVERAGLAVPRRVWEELANDGHMAETLADHARALEVQLDGVPRMVVEGGTIVPTWVDPNEVRANLRAAIAEAAATSSAAAP